jgi:hypothetical protein
MTLMYMPIIRLVPAIPTGYDVLILVLRQTISPKV